MSFSDAFGLSLYVLCADVYASIYSQILTALLECITTSRTCHYLGASQEKAFYPAPLIHHPQGIGSNLKSDIQTSVDGIQPAPNSHLIKMPLIHGQFVKLFISVLSAATAAKPLSASFISASSESITRFTK